MKIDGCQTRPEIDYPCPWLFKVIGLSCREIERAIEEVVGVSSYSITYSNVSTSGKYHSLNLEMEVISEEHRLGLYQNLADHDSIKVVI